MERVECPVLEGFILFCGFVVGKLLLRLASLGSDGGHPSIELAFAVSGADDPGGISNVCAHRAALVEENPVDGSHAIEQAQGFVNVWAGLEAVFVCDFLANVTKSYFTHDRDDVRVEELETEYEDPTSLRANAQVLGVADYPLGGESLPLESGKYVVEVFLAIFLESCYVFGY